MQTLRVHAQGSEAEHAWIDLMPVERFAREHDTIPELSLCFARISRWYVEENHLWVTDNDLITGQAVNSDGAPMDYREFHRYPPLLIGAFHHVKGLPHRGEGGLVGRGGGEWPREMCLEMVTRIADAPTPQLGVVIRMAFPVVAQPQVVGACFIPQVRDARVPAFLQFAFSLFTVPHAK